MSDLAGFKLLRWEYGAVADLRTPVTFGTPYYVGLVFIKGTYVQYELFPAENFSMSLDLRFLGRVVSEVQRKPGFGIQKLVFTDGSFWNVS